MPSSSRTPDPRRARDPHVITVAKAAINGGARMEPRAPEEVHVRTGQPLHVRLLYRLTRPATDDEHYRVVLESTLGPHAVGPVVLEKGDRLGIPDELWGFVQQEYILDRPGEYLLSVTATATYTVQGGAGSEDLYRATVRVRAE